MTLSQAPSPAKIQRIGGSSSPDPISKESAQSFIEEPADTPVLASHGSLYAVVDFKGGDEENTSDFRLISRLIWDTLRESYFGNLESTPLQSLEKAFSAVSERMLGLNLNPAPDQVGALPAEFNLVAVVSWGKYLYTAILGSGKIFLIRGLGIKEIVADPGAGYSLTSNTLEGNDIIMLVSKYLGSYLTAENLFKHLETLDQDIAASKNTAGKAALIIKNTILPEATGPVNKKSNLVRRLKSRMLPTGRENDLTPSQKKQRLLGISVVLLGLVFVGSLFMSFSQKKSGQTKTQVLGDSTTELAAEVAAIQGNFDITSRKAKSDLKVAFDVWDKLSPEDKKSQKVKDLVETLNSLNISAYKIQTLASFKEASMPAEIYHAQQNIQKAVGVDPTKVTSATVWLNSGVTLALAPIYLVVPSEQQIYKASAMAGGKYTVVAKWLLAPADLGSGVGIAVDDGVWVLTDDNIKRFYTKAPVNFTLSGLDKPFNKPQALYTSYGLNNLYVYDAGNNRLVVFSKSGEYQFQVLLPPVPSGARGMVVDEAKQTFTLVAGSSAVSGTWQ